MTAKTVTDNERQLRFQVVQAFVTVLLAKSTLQFAREDLANFSQEVDLNHARLVAGDLAEGDYLKISLQKLQFEQDVSSAELSLVQARATLRQLLGYQSVADGFDVTGALAHKKQMVQLGRSGETGAGDAAGFAGRAKRSEARERQRLPGVRQPREGLDLVDRLHLSEYRAQWDRQRVGFALSFDLADSRPQSGEIARSQAAVRQAVETESSTEVGVRTDVVNAYYGLQTNEQIVSLYESGYLNQATQSRDITIYAYGRGAATVLDVLDAERSYRATQLGYRQAIAAYMTAAEQVNQAVGARVIR